jgi:hypothetical protein
MFYQRRYPNAPWLSRGAVEILENWLKPCDRGIEWGSGRSTIWFAERVGYLVSVEHNPDWHKRVSAQLKRKGLKNVEYRLCEEPRQYCSVAEKLPPESFDFCLVDGEERDQCALAAISLVKPGGIVIADNCNWYLPTLSRSPLSRRPEQGPYTEKWAAYLNSVKGWRQIWTTNGVFDTGLWVKPADTREPNPCENLSEQFSVRLQT